MQNDVVENNENVHRFSKRKKRLAILLLVVIAVTLLIWGIYWWRSGRFLQSTDDAYVGGNVTVISPRVSGYVARILVQDNARVKAGQPLIALDDADFRAQLTAAQAEASAAKAAIIRLQAQQQLARADIRGAQAQLEESRATLRFAEHETRRYQSLASARVASVQDAQRARSQFEAAQAREKAAIAALASRNQQLTVVDAEIGEARTRVEKAQAEEQQARLNLSYTTLYAPTEGYVGNRAVSPGTFVAAGNQLLSLIPLAGMWVDANFKEDQIRHMRPGQPVTIEADVDSGLAVTGHLSSLAPATGAVFSIIPAQNATGNFTKIVQRVPVRITLDAPADRVGALRPGLSVTATVNTESRNHD